MSERRGKELILHPLLPRGHKLHTKNPLISTTSYPADPGYEGPTFYRPDPTHFPPRHRKAKPERDRTGSTGFPLVLVMPGAPWGSRGELASFTGASQCRLTFRSGWCGVRWAALVAAAACRPVRGPPPSFSQLGSQHTKPRRAVPTHCYAPTPYEPPAQGPASRGPMVEQTVSRVKAEGRSAPNRTEPGKRWQPVTSLPQPHPAAPSRIRIEPTRGA